jgi:hypothetical protein
MNTDIHERAESYMPARRDQSDGTMVLHSTLNASFATVLARPLRTSAALPERTSVAMGSKSGNTGRLWSLAHIRK